MDDISAALNALGADYIVKVGESRKIPTNSTVYVCDTKELFKFYDMDCADCAFCATRSSGWPCGMISGTKLFACGWKKIDG